MILKKEIVRNVYYTHKTYVKSLEVHRLIFFIKTINRNILFFLKNIYVSEIKEKMKDVYFLRVFIEYKWESCLQQIFYAI